MRCRLFLAVVAVQAPLLGCSEKATSREPYVLPGIGFSPYIDGQDPNMGDSVTYAQVWDRMSLVKDDARWIRTYGVNSGLDVAGEVAHLMGRGAAIGAWLGPDQDANATEVAQLIDLAQQGKVDLAIVGSEVLLRGDLTKPELLAHIHNVRTQIPSQIPVTTAEVYPIYLSNSDLVAAVDVLMVNYYPFWAGIAIDDAVAAVHCWHAAVLTAAQGKDVFVSETGWPSDGDPVGAAIPTVQNASRYFQEFVSWARQEQVFFFYFAGLDEEWKALYEGPQGAHWGIRDKYGVLKPGMARVFHGHTVQGDWRFDPLPGGPGFPAIELTFVPPIGSFQDLRGQVWHVNPPSHRVAVYIRVGSGWWTKPFWNTPLTVVNCDGDWVCDITTGGIDETANRVAAFLLPTGVQPPSMSGGPALPNSLYDSAVAYVIVDR